MRVELVEAGSTSRYVVTGLPAKLHDAARALEYQETAEGWTRGFPSGSAYLETAYRNFRRRCDSFFRQRAGLRPVPWEQALTAFLDRVEGERIRWWLVGSAALAARGVGVAPRDLDLVVDDSGALLLGAMLEQDLIEPVCRVEGWVSRWFGRSFPGACLEWAGGITEMSEAEGDTDFGSPAYLRRERIEWNGHSLEVPPLDLALAVNRRRERWATVRAIEEFQMRRESSRPTSNPRDEADDAP